jgi:hypothetical protein
MDFEDQFYPDSFVLGAQDGTLAFRADDVRETQEPFEDEDGWHDADGGLHLAVMGNSPAENLLGIRTADWGGHDCEKCGGRITNGVCDVCGSGPTSASRTASDPVAGQQYSHPYGNLTVHEVQGGDIVKLQWDGETETQTWRVQDFLQLGAEPTGTVVSPINPSAYAASRARAAQTPADIIWSQIPASTKMEIGAHNPMHQGENTLIFSVKPAMNQKGTFEITYDNGMDTYSVRYLDKDAQEIYSADMVYFDSLGTVLPYAMTTRLLGPSRFQSGAARRRLQRDGGVAPWISEITGEEPWATGPQCQCGGTMVPSSANGESHWVCTECGETMGFAAAAARRALQRHRSSGDPGQRIRLVSTAGGRAPAV